MRSFKSLFVMLLRLDFFLRNTVPPVALSSVLGLCYLARRVDALSTRGRYLSETCTRDVFLGSRRRFVRSRKVTVRVSEFSVIVNIPGPFFASPGLCL